LPIKAGFAIAQPRSEFFDQAKLMVAAPMDGTLPQTYSLTTANAISESPGKVLVINPWIYWQWVYQ
jgi:hypothetical protein